MTARYRPLVQCGHARPDDALPLAGGPRWFSQCVRHTRGEAVTVVSVCEVPQDVLARLTAPREPVAGLSMDGPRIMGILNVTPDSFSDGGTDASAQESIARAHRMLKEGADILDIGGESTRPGAPEVPVDEEIARVVPVTEALKGVPISIDTRKAAVARAAAEAGATLINDVSGLVFDPEMTEFCASSRLPVCVMHMRGTPETMSAETDYADVLLDVYDFLETQVHALEHAGLPREKIVVDPGIGFAKTLDQNLALLHGLSLFHGLGCAILLGVSRKGFIGKLSGETEAAKRFPGSIATALAGVAQGAQIIRVHDVRETRQALTLWQAVEEGGQE
ncbi:MULTISPECIES: dihydropteroate synthase [unclassified Salipiger]|uniref:dihydropteroate synthase n=1 Tax=unclassified Salipiger TaxID=2640570 RepID=UPI0013B7B604|nr:MULTISPECIES: dihydropteroate synthase [unclassified Salipiger]NDV49470.1 dihydropteroate synthase [Salipiger sp. PrR003]NDW32604.1 dihydropteroate synthase [Salipiger sp. PrR007]